MASTISAGTTSGTAIAVAGDTSGVLQLQTNGTTTAMTIDTSQNVGIGTASPSNPLHVVGAIRTSSGANFAQFSNNFLRSNAAGSFFYDNATVGQSNEFRTSVSSSLDTTALTLTASGILALRNAATNATGIGITFPATQSASSNANTLDDYEEGTWTPNDSSGAGLTLTFNTGSTYTKVGNIVTAFASINYPVNASGLQATIGGLPFTSASAGYAGATPRYTDRSFMHFGAINTSNTVANIYGLSGTAPTNASFSGGRTDLMFVYLTS